jgi:hypothetical protein
MPPQSRKEFEIAIICALTVEADAVQALFNEHYYDYVVLVLLPKMGRSSC